jgi:hypothetical protein
MIITALYFMPRNRRAKIETFSALQQVWIEILFCPLQQGAVCTPLTRVDFAGMAAFWKHIIKKWHIFC